MIRGEPTTPEREHRAGALFLTAAELGTEGRESLLAEVGKSDPALRLEVEALLEADRRNSDGFLRGPITDWPVRGQQEQGDDEAPTAIGPFEIIRELGRGEHAAVYLARQKQPIEREVAIKVMRDHQGPREILRRFETERRILALMEHPNITRLFDAGVTTEGRAYFVMEYVRGGPISAHCRERGLTIRERLRLFCDVCRAVEHAHQKGIIHRDLKPTNILVAPEDGGATVKVIDFGVARASGAGLYAFPSHTQHGQMVGTVAYMSPEQIGGDGLLVDTRSDVYGLGVVLYEVICDSPAFDASSAGPATVITDITLKGARSPRSVRRAIPRDVDAIIRKAIEREPMRRYPSVAALRIDIERYLAGRAIESRASRRLYVARKFVARHRLSVGMLGMLAALLVGLDIQDTVSDRQKFGLAVELAQAGFDQTREMARTAGERGRRRPLLVVLETQSRELFEKAPSHTGVLHLRADVLGARGDLHMEDGEPSSAYALFEQALDIRTRLTQLDPASHLYRIERSIATVRLGDAARSLRRHDEAERLYLHAMVLDEQLYRERPGMPRAVTLLAWSCDRLASYAGGRREWDRSEALYAKCLALMQRLCAIENSADAHRGLCTAHIHVGDTAKRHGDEEAYRDHVEHALEQAEIAASLSPNDRLARWGLLSVRCTYLDSRRPLISPTDAASYASQTLAQARELAGLDAADFTMHSVLTRAQVAAAECAEVSGNIRTAMELRDEHVRTCRQIHELHPDDEEAEHGLQDAIAAQSELIKRLRLDGGF